MTYDENFRKGFKIYLLSKESILYEKYINKMLEKNGFGDFKTICFSPEDMYEVEGFNPRSKSPYFLISIAHREHLEEAHSSIKKTNYFSKLGSDYRNFLSSNEGDCE